MISSILAVDGSRIIMIVVLLVLFVGMMLISIIPQKKKQKEYEAMQSAIKVGTRIMTIGRLIGTVVAINTDNTIEVDIGTKGNPVIILINREGIGLNLDAQQVAPDSKGDIKTNSVDGDVDADEATFTETESTEDKSDDDLWQEVTSKCRPVALFKEYLETGYYPFLLEGEGEYYTKIEQIVNYIIETELPRICKVDVANVRKLQALVALLCNEVPFELNANKIAAALEIGRDTVVEYLKYLGDAKVLNLLYSDKKKIGKLTKPDKVYLENPNIIYALAPSRIEIGTLRETFAINSLSESHNVEYGKAQGDFLVDSKYSFEIGGRSKDFSQIAGVEDSYVFADDWDIPDGAKLPLWMLGFLY